MDVRVRCWTDEEIGSEGQGLTQAPIEGRAVVHRLLPPSPQLPVFLLSSRNHGLLSASLYDSVTMETTVRESSK